MSKTSAASIIIRYADGNTNKFTFTRQEDAFQALQRVNDALKSNWLVELEDRALLTPVHSIRNIEILPKPATFPNHALRNARLVT